MSNADEQYAYWLMPNGYDIYQVAYYVGKNGRFVVTGHWGPLDIMDTISSEAHEHTDHLDRRAGYENHWLTEEQEAFTTISHFPLHGITRAVVTLELDLGFNPDVLQAELPGAVEQELKRLFGAFQEWEVKDIAAPARKEGIHDGIQQ